MDKLKNLKEKLVHCVESQVYGDMNSVDAEELGEVVDMVKDLSEAIYYCTIVEAMEKKEDESIEPKYYPVMYYGGDSKRMYDDRDVTRVNRMYYDTPIYYNTPSRQDSNSSYYPMEIRDYREGRSPMSRRTYMESKEMHQDKAVQMKDLEKYLKELSEDITEMISDATPDEKTLLQQKLTTLANKVK